MLDLGTSMKFICEWDESMVPKLLFVRKKYINLKSH